MYVTMIIKWLTHSCTHHHEADDDVKEHHADIGWHFPDYATEKFPTFDGQIPCIQYVDPLCPKLVQHLLGMDAEDAQDIKVKFEC